MYTGCPKKCIHIKNNLKVNVYTFFWNTLYIKIYPDNLEQLQTSASRKDYIYIYIYMCCIVMTNYTHIHAET